MPKHEIVASRLMQIVGHDGDVEPGTVLATIETDCEIGSLLSALQYGGASIVREGDTEVETTSTTKPSRRKPVKPTQAQPDA